MKSTKRTVIQVKMEKESLREEGLLSANVADGITEFAQNAIHALFAFDRSFVQGVVSFETVDVR